MALIADSASLYRLHDGRNPLPDEDLCVRPGSGPSYWGRLLIC